VTPGGPFLAGVQAPHGPGGTAGGLAVLPGMLSARGSKRGWAALRAGPAASSPGGGAFDGMDAVSVWVEFGIALALITAAGSELARQGDVIAGRTGMGGTWVGLILLATVTSLPELITGVSAVVLADAADIAVGAVLGSCVFNLLIIVVLDFLMREEPLYSRLSPNHILSAAFGIILIGVVGFSLLLDQSGRGLTIGHVGAYSPIITVIYLMAVRTLFRHERNHASGPLETEALERGAPLGAAPWIYALAATVVVATGVWLPFIGERLAVVMGVGKTFVGTLLIALATSLPEVVVTVAALRIRAFNMAVSNLFGSNLFNVLILVVEDLVFVRGSILAGVSELHTISAMSAIVMTGIAVVGLVYRPQRRLFRRIGWASLFLLSIYLINFTVLYLYGT
jgi:cation:H+ antiporter